VNCTTAEIAKELDVQGRGIPATVATTTYMGMNALHAAGGRGRLPAYRYLVEEVGMDVDKPDTAQGNWPLSDPAYLYELIIIINLSWLGARIHARGACRHQRLPSSRQVPRQPRR
jgi:hypothetical protein